MQYLKSKATSENQKPDARNQTSQGVREKFLPPTLISLPSSYKTFLKWTATTFQPEAFTDKFRRSYPRAS